MPELRKKTDMFACSTNDIDTLHAALLDSRELEVRVDISDNVYGSYIYLRNKERAQTFIDQLQELVNQMPDEGQSND